MIDTIWKTFIQAFGDKLYGMGAEKETLQRRCVCESDK